MRITSLPMVDLPGRILLAGLVMEIRCSLCNAASESTTILEHRTLHAWANLKPHAVSRSLAIWSQSCGMLINMVSWKPVEGEGKEVCLCMPACGQVCAVHVWAAWGDSGGKQESWNRDVHVPFAFQTAVGHKGGPHLLDLGMFRRDDAVVVWQGLRLGDAKIARKGGDLTIKVSVLRPPCIQHMTKGSHLVCHTLLVGEGNTATSCHDGERNCHDLKVL